MVEQVWSSDALNQQLRALHAVAEDIDARAFRLLSMGVGQQWALKEAMRLVSDASVLMFSIKLRHVPQRDYLDSDALVESLWALGFVEEPLENSIQRVGELLTLAQNRMLNALGYVVLTGGAGV